MYQNTINKLSEKNALLESENSILRQKIRDKNKYIKHLLRLLNGLDRKEDTTKVCKNQISIYDILGS